VPTRLVRLDALPVMPNGKIDRNALPAVDLDDAPRQHVPPRTATEARLVQIWGTVLKRDDIGVTDDFFECGGDSLSALSVAAMARAAGLQRFTLEALFAHRTIDALATVIDRAPGDNPANILLLNSSAAADIRIFCIHPGYGLVSEYRPLAEALEGIAKVYGVQSPGFTEPDWCPQDMETLAQEYVQRIRRVQPEGPYRLLGWSIGGVIAFAMADILTQAGEAVSFVGLVDSLPPGVIEPSDVVPMSEEMEVAAVLDELAHRIPDDPLVSAERTMIAGRVVTVGRIHRSIFQRYRLPRKLTVDLGVWWAQRRLARGGQEARWATLTTGEVKVADRVDADHADIISHPAFLAGLYERILDDLSKSNIAALRARREASRR
jgi:thioesterase domain-containing protein/aryl carrier-like protein